MHVVKGDLFQSGADALVNPINTQLIHGAGLAKKFKDWFPQSTHKLARISRGKSGIKAGELIPVYDHQNQVWVYYWATKSVWSKPSLMEYITRGAEQLAKLQKTTPRTVAMPAVGCGLGGLDWSEVEAELDRILGDTPGITVYMR